MDPDAPPSYEAPTEQEDDEEVNPLLEYLCGNTEHQSYGDIREVLATKQDPKSRFKPKKVNTPDPKQF
jgi:hypothetical protein